MLAVNLYSRDYISQISLGLSLKSGRRSRPVFSRCFQIQTQVKAGSVVDVVIIRSLSKLGIVYCEAKLSFRQLF